MMTLTTVERPGTVARRGRFRRAGRRAYGTAMDANVAVIRAALERATADGARTLCDVGCWDAGTTIRYLPDGLRAAGIDQSPDAVFLARNRGVAAVIGDLGRPWPFREGSFDVVSSNQVIEHMGDIDHFVGEARRVLAPGGWAVISTENLASWHNIVALTAGWQPFSLANTSILRAAIGNPLANLRHGEPLAAGWQHVRVMAPRGLRELFEAHGFEQVAIEGAGYYPLPARVGRWDPRHAAFLTVVARAPG